MYDVFWESCPQRHQRLLQSKVEILFQRIAWNALEHICKNPFKKECCSVINSVVEFVKMALIGYRIFSDILDKAVDLWQFLTRSIYFQLLPL